MILCKNHRPWNINIQAVLINAVLCNVIVRSSHPDVFLGKGVLKICSKFTRRHPCWSAISIKLQSNFIEIALLDECSPVNLLIIFRKPFPRHTSWWLLLNRERLNPSWLLLAARFIFYHFSWVSFCEILMSVSELPEKLVLFASMEGL